MTVLAEQAAFGVSLPGFQAVVHIIFDKLVEFGVKLWLLATFVGVGTPIGELHQSLVGYADSFTAVMAGNAGFMGNP